MATYYAWSPIHYHDDKGKQVVYPGDEVSAEMLGVDKEGWKALVEGGSVRKEEYPEGLNPRNPNALSPNEHQLRNLRLEHERLEAQMASAGGSSSADEEAQAEKEKQAQSQSRVP